MCTNIDESSNSKRKALELITNIFRKKSKECLKNWNETENHPPVPTIDTPSHHPLDDNTNTTTSDESQGIEGPGSSSFHLSDYGIPPHSPVSPRVKNIDEDMEALTLSRQDNPFIVSKLEKLSNSGELLSSSSSLAIHQDHGHYVSPPTTSHVSSNDYFNQSCHFSPLKNSPSPSPFSLEIEELTQDDSNLHQHLIRSPPPQFPTKFSHFVFPLPNSPIRNLSSRCNAFLSPDRRSDFRSGSINLSTTTNPADKLTFQSTHSLSIKSPPKLFNSYRKSSIGLIGDKLIDQPSSCSSSSSSSSNTNRSEGRRASSGSFKNHGSPKLSIAPGQSSSNAMAAKMADSHSPINCSKSSSNLTNNRDHHTNHVIDYLKGRITNKNDINEDGDKLMDNEDDENNNGHDLSSNHGENNSLSNSREALISTQSSLLDASN